MQPELTREQRVLHKNDPHSPLFTLRSLFARCEKALWRHLLATYLVKRKKTARQSLGQTCPKTSTIPISSEEATSILASTSLWTRLIILKGFEIKIRKSVTPAQLEFRENNPPRQWCTPRLSSNKTWLLRAVELRLRLPCTSTKPNWDYFSFFLSSLLLSSLTRRRFYPQRSSGQAEITGGVPSPP